MSCNNFDFFTGTCTQVDVGKDFEKVLTYTGPTDTPIDITGFDFNMTIKDKLGGTILLTLPTVGDNLTTGFFIPSPITGIINMQITQADTVLVGNGTFPYELIETDPDGKDFIFMQGTIQFFDKNF